MTATDLCLSTVFFGLGWLVSWLTSHRVLMARCNYAEQAAGKRGADVWRIYKQECLLRREALIEAQRNLAESAARESDLRRQVEAWKEAWYRQRQATGYYGAMQVPEGYAVPR